MLKSKFCSFPAISLLVRGWGVEVGGWGKAENKAKLSPAGATSWAELGNKLIPAGAGSWAELGKNAVNSGHLFP